MYKGENKASKFNLTSNRISVAELLKKVLGSLLFEEKVAVIRSFFD